MNHNFHQEILSCQGWHKTHSLLSLLVERPSAARLPPSLATCYGNMKLMLACVCSLFSEMQTHPSSQTGQCKPPEGKHDADVPKETKAVAYASKPEFLMQRLSSYTCTSAKEKGNFLKDERKRCSHIEKETTTILIQGTVTLSAGNSAV